MSNILTSLTRAKVVFQQRTIHALLTEGQPSCTNCGGTGTINHGMHGTEPDSRCPDCTEGDER